MSKITITLKAQQNEFKRALEAHKATNQFERPELYNAQKKVLGSIVRRIKKTLVNIVQGGF